MGHKIEKIENLDATFSAPPSKAHTLRALFISSLADGKSVLKNALNADDQIVAANALSSFGAQIDFKGDDFIVKGTGGDLKEPKKDIFVENSGVSARFLLPFAALAKSDCVIDGTARMRQRPLGELISSLSTLGVRIDSQNGFLPLKVHGVTFAGGSCSIKSDESSQFLSAILLSAPYTKKGIHAKIEGEMKSKPYVDITVDCMRSFGIPTVCRQYKEFFVSGNSHYRAQKYQIEGDYSSASYFFAAAAISGGKVKVKNLNADSKQGDKFFLKILERIGCSIEHGNDYVTVRGPEAATLLPIEIDMANYPDIVPTLAVALAFANGRSVIKNIGHLAVKESNRIESICSNLSACGIKNRAGADFIEIQGAKPHAASINTFGDHRVAMAFSIMGLAVDGIEIENPQVVSKSYPNFFEELSKAGG
ncbi:MAG TPA: 3-phosphoshikimate 1-carboxyvinyltransferase [archaeon]|nr:3-phosphoshikimate 1-carboxyvinyltransferase [archaeon]